jgi:hypothetical protein
MAHRQSHGTIHSEAREIIANIIEKCSEKKLNKNLLLLLQKAMEHAAVYAGVSYTTVKYIRKRARKESKATPKVGCSHQGRREDTFLAALCA